MNTLSIAALCIVLAVPLSAANADPGKQKGKGHERSAGLDDGVCQVERKWGKKGDYKEEMRCRGARPGGFAGYGSSTYPRYYGAPPAYLYEPPPAYWYGYR
jgi:hypothetical protein